MVNSFHFLRPWWFIALIPAIILFVMLLKKSNLTKNNWETHCDPHLLPYLIVGNKLSKSIWLPTLLFMSWLVAILALAGPTWSLYAEPVYQKNIARVIALDVSQSMNANDIVPSRLQRAKYKVLDLLHQIKEGQTGMIVFSSAAFVVSPLTADSNTIASMIPVLDSNIVPVQGSDITKALEKSVQLLSQAGYSQGQIILFTDSTPDESAIKEAEKLATEGYITSVIAMGTKQGGPIVDANGGFVTDTKGNIVFANLDNIALGKLAAAGAGVYIPFSNENMNLNQLLNNSTLDGLENKPSKRMQTKSLWKDEGHWLIWLLIILVSFLANRQYADAN